MPAGDKGTGKGERERAEVSRSRAATSHLSCRRGRSRRAGGRWRQSHPVPPHPSPCRNVFLSSPHPLPCPCFSYLHLLPYFLSLFPTFSTFPTFPDIKPLPLYRTTELASTPLLLKISSGKVRGFSAVSIS